MNAVPTLADRIGAYILAKDGNRPHLVETAFAPDATLEMVVRTDAIAFPALTEGRNAIAELLVRRFALQYENVYTLCIGEAPPANAMRCECGWLVVMTERGSGRLRIGHGRYEWSADSANLPVRRLYITIEHMEVLESAAASPVLDWVRRLPYPWCPRDALRNGMPAAVTPALSTL